MLEIPEAIVFSRQLNDSIKGKRIRSVVAGASPHSFTWYFEDPANYDALLSGRLIEGAEPFGGRINIYAEGASLQLADGVGPRFLCAGAKLPKKHQLLVSFDDETTLVCTVAMYGGIWAFPDGAMGDNIYYLAALNAVPPLSDLFDFEFFSSLLASTKSNLSAKQFLATEQRIPGLGNGVLQDILLNAKIHPKTKMASLTPLQMHTLFDSIKSTLREMVDGGGRDTERDVFGNSGGYRTKLSRNNKLAICPNCGSAVKKETYLGGSIYFCANCQVLG